MYPDSHGRSFRVNHDIDGSFLMLADRRERSAQVFQNVSTRISISIPLIKSVDQIGLRSVAFLSHLRRKPRAFETTDRHLMRICNRLLRNLSFSVLISNVQPHLQHKDIDLALAVFLHCIDQSNMQLVNQRSCKRRNEPAIATSEFEVCDTNRLSCKRKQLEGH